MADDLTGGELVERGALRGQVRLLERRDAGRLLRRGDGARHRLFQVVSGAHRFQPAHKIGFGFGGGGGEAEQGGAGVRGLTLVHYSAQPERFVWNRGCA